MKEFLRFLVGTGQRRLGFWTGVGCVIASGLLQATVALALPTLPLGWLWIDLSLAVLVGLTAYRRGYGRAFGIGLLGGIVVAGALALPVAALILVGAALA